MIKATDGIHTIEVGYDSCPENPREYYEPVGTMVCWHRRYALGDKHTFDSPQDFQEEEMKKAFVVLPLFLYDHSGLAMSTSSFVGRAVHAEWDSGQVGYIYIPEDKVQEKTGFEPTEDNKAHIQELLEDEVRLYNKYLQGDVYSFSIKDSDGDWIAGGHSYYSDSIEDAVDEMKECCWEYESLFEKLQAQFRKTCVAE